MEDVDFSVTAGLRDELDPPVAPDGHLLTVGRLETHDITGWCNKPIAAACRHSIWGQMSFHLVVMFPTSAILPPSGP
jgi:hypothetical protein